MCCPSAAQDRWFIHFDLAQHPSDKGNGACSPGVKQYQIISAAAYKLIIRRIDVVNCPQLAWRTKQYYEPTDAACTTA